MDMHQCTGRAYSAEQRVKAGEALDIALLVVREKDHIFQLKSVRMLRNDQQRTGYVLSDIIGIAAQQILPRARGAMRAHNDQTDIVLFYVMVDGLYKTVFSRAGGDLHIDIFPQLTDKLNQPFFSSDLGALFVRLIGQGALESGGKRPVGMENMYVCLLLPRQFYAIACCYQGVVRKVCRHQNGLLHIFVLHAIPVHFHCTGYSTKNTKLRWLWQDIPHISGMSGQSRMDYFFRFQKSIWRKSYFELSNTGSFPS